jgi:UDP-3-O-acyl-N-acetylglucosamine deacetylase
VSSPTHPDAHATPHSTEGRGLFSGAATTVEFRSAQPGHGLVFVREPSPHAPHAMRVPANLDSLVATPASLPSMLRARCTTLGSPGPQPGGGDPGEILTVEHVLSACIGLGVWDAEIIIQGPELPIGDGSAAIFLEALRARTESGERHAPEPCVIASALRVQDPRDPQSWIEARPRAEPGCAYRYELDYGPAMADVLPSQSASIVLNGESTAAEYAREVAPARTFSFEAEAQAMRAAGLFTGFSPRDLLVIGPQGPIDNAWRFDNEPARHKLLDLIGDLALIGAPIQGEIVAHRSGHALNHTMARAILASTP